MYREIDRGEDDTSGKRRYYEHKTPNAAYLCQVRGDTALQFIGIVNRGLCERPEDWQ